VVYYFTFVSFVLGFHKEDNNAIESIKLDVMTLGEFVRF